MELVLSKIEDIEKYNPYIDLSGNIDTEFFEGYFLEYYKNFKEQVERLKLNLGKRDSNRIDKLFNDVVRHRNDDIINKILENYSLIKNSNVSEYKNIVLFNEKNIKELKAKIRKIKDIILISESSNARRLQQIDAMAENFVDKGSALLGITVDKNEDGLNLSEILNDYQEINADQFYDATISLKSKIKDLCNYYRRNFSLNLSTKEIRKINSKVNKLIDDKAKELNIIKSEKQNICELIAKYSNSSLGYEEWLDELNKEYGELKNKFKSIYYLKTLGELNEFLDNKIGTLKNKRADELNVLQKQNNKLLSLFESYKPEDIDIFDIMFYSNIDECNNARSKYELMTKEEQKVFEMRIYEQYIRFFKEKVRQFNKDIRRLYSVARANSIIKAVTKKADKYVCQKAKEIGKPVPKNPWFVRKYLWSDTDNFISDKGIKIRKIINPLLKAVVPVAMKNKLIIEERPKLDPTKQYIFVSTHYFTEDVIGLFSSLERQAFMLMGTTDQIENNPLMVAAKMFGFFHVDRMDKCDRKRCLEKQDRILEHNASFINYVSGSWENSENELQPLSFSGPYRTSKKNNVQIVPLASYLVREKKEMYVRYGEPLDLSAYDEETANMIIRDTLASMHFKQMSKHSVPIETIYIDGYGKTHNLPYEQHIAYMEQIGKEYWNQPWSKPFAKEEIGVRSSDCAQYEDVYSFVDNLSRENLIKLSNVLSHPLLRRYEKNERYNIVNYIDNNYDRFKRESKIRVKKQNRKVS